MSIELYLDVLTLGAALGACFYAAAALLFAILVSREKLQKKENVSL